MSEHDFELYLTLLAKTLRLSDTQRDAISSELRDHLEARLEELTAQGLDKHDAIQTALAEFGDASALANDFTSIRKPRTRRHLMQTAFGTIAAAAAVAFAVMTLTPSNYQGHPNQQGVVAQDASPGAAQDPSALGGAGAIEDPAAAGGAAPNNDQAFGVSRGRGGAVAPAARGSGRGGNSLGGLRGSVDPQADARSAQPAPELKIHVVDCTAILSPRDDGLDLLARTEALASAVEQTVGAIRPQGPSEIQVRAFEEFLIITATDAAYSQAESLLENISSHVQRRDAIQHERDLLEQRDALHRVQREIERNAAELDELQAAAVNTRAQRDALEAEGVAIEHADYRRLTMEYDNIQAIIETLRANRAELEHQYRQLRNLGGR
ncbi:permease prefix domain 1-containing protein [Phycisphaeraceae bacterium D3-23]